MGEYLRDNWKMVLIGIAGILLGAYSTYLVNKRTNSELLMELKAELAALQLKSNTSRTTEDEEVRMQVLEGQISLLENK